MLYLKCIVFLGIPIWDLWSYSTNISSTNTTRGTTNEHSECVSAYAFVLVLPGVALVQLFIHVFKVKNIVFFPKHLTFFIIPNKEMILTPALKVEILIVSVSREFELLPTTFIFLIWADGISVFPVFLE